MTYFKVLHVDHGCFLREIVECFEAMVLKSVSRESGIKKRRALQGVPLSLSTVSSLSLLISDSISFDCYLIALLPELEYH